MSFLFINSWVFGRQVETNTTLDPETAAAAHLWLPFPELRMTRMVSATPQAEKKLMRDSGVESVGMFTAFRGGGCDRRTERRFYAAFCFDAIEQRQGKKKKKEKRREKNAQRIRQRVRRGGYDNPSV